jgi:hypothetical protein
MLDVLTLPPLPTLPGGSGTGAAITPGPDMCYWPEGATLVLLVKARSPGAPSGSTASA